MIRQGYKNNHITIAKALGIIFMVMGHAWTNTYLHDIIYLFHMPLFFFCSGYFFNNEDSFINILKKRINKLYLPYFKWTLLVFLLHNVFYYLHIYNKNFGLTYYSQNYFYIKDFSKYIFNIFIFMNGSETRLLGGFWFIKVLLWTSLITAFFRSIEKKMNATVVLKLLLFISIPLSILCRKYNIGMPIIGSLDIVFMAITFYLLGFYWRKYEPKITYNIYSVLFTLICICAIPYFWKDPSMFVPQNLIIYYYISALIGIFFCFGVSFLLKRYNISLLYYIGNHSFTILALHFFSFKIISLWIIYINHLSLDYLGIFPVIEGCNSAYYIAYTIVGIFIPLFFSFFYRLFVKAVVKSILHIPLICNILKQ